MPVGFYISVQNCRGETSSFTRLLFRANRCNHPFRSVFDQGSGRLWISRNICIYLGKGCKAIAIVCRIDDNFKILGGSNFKADGLWLQIAILQSKTTYWGEGFIVQAYLNIKLVHLPRT